ncbi:MAG: hypothetical protein ACYC6L_06490 [Anaerolineae bacterium]
MQVFLDDIICPEFLGVNAVYHGFAYMPDNIARGMTEADAQREFNLIRTCGLRLARAWYRPDYACGSSLANPFNWESTEMRAFYRWLGVMQQLGVQVALQAGWWFTRDTYHGYEGPVPERDLPRFSEWVSASLHQLIEVRGFSNITHLSLFTEGVNYPSGSLPEGLSQTAYYGRCIRAIHERLVADGRRQLVRTVGPNSGSTTQAYWIETAAAEYDDCLDVYSWHSYNGADWNSNPPQEYAGWANLAAQGTRKLAAAGISKPYWFDEYGANQPGETVRFAPDYGNYLAQAVAAFTNAGCQTSLIWILLDQKYPSETTNNDSFYRGVQRWGLAPWPRDDVPDPLTPRPAWYAFALMSKVLGGGAGYCALRTACDADVYIAAIAQPAGHYAFLVVNAAHAPCEFSVALSRPLDVTLARYTYDPAAVHPAVAAALPPADKQLAVADRWSDSLPARGVVLYTTKMID